MDLRWIPLFSLVLVTACSQSSSTDQHRHRFLRDTGGVLLAEQAGYDVRHYDLQLQVFPDSRSIEGTLTVQADVVAPLSEFVLDLDPALTVSAVREEARGGLEIRSHEHGKLRVELNPPAIVGDRLELSVKYGGEPREAPRPPWEGGFMWSTTKSGEPWIATANQMEGADLWWPCKDHPSDKPDSFDLHIRVPQPLVCATNGKWLSTEAHDDGTHTWHWRVSTPISNYCIALNIAPYVELKHDYISTGGQSLPVSFWVLPEDEARGRERLPEFVDHLRFFEQILGPYPFRADKYGVVQTPHLGMEHQTIIAYGYDFQHDEWGYDWLHHHELSHEWFANLITCPDWNDFWIHEGFGSYLQKLYIEDKHGMDGYHQALAGVRDRILNRKAVAPRQARSSAQMYFVDLSAPDGERQSDGDIYFKGEWILHTLRFLVGKPALLRSMRRMCYRDPHWESVIDGSHCVFRTTNDYQAILEAECGQELDWFFELYLRQPALPQLVTQRRGDRLLLEWKTPEDRPFPMPVEIRVGEQRQRIPMPDNRAEIRIGTEVDFEVDPDDWILRVGNRSR